MIILMEFVETLIQFRHDTFSCKEYMLRDATDCMKVRIRV